jgi:hypothetical protein
MTTVKSLSDEPVIINNLCLFKSRLILFYRLIGLIYNIRWFGKVIHLLNIVLTL